MVNPLNAGWFPEQHRNCAEKLKRSHKKHGMSALQPQPFFPRNVQLVEAVVQGRKTLNDTVRVLIWIVKMNAFCMWAVCGVYLYTTREMFE